MTNATESEHLAEPIFNEIAKLVPLSFAIVTINVLVVVLFYKKRYLHTLPNYPLLSLAVCDFITGFVNIPLFIFNMYLLTRDMSTKQTKSYLSYLVLVLHALTSTLAVYHILVVIAEKYFAIVWPLKHRLLTKKKMSIVLVAVWLVSFMVAFVPFSWIKLSQKPVGRKFFVGNGIFCLVIVFFVSYAFIVYALVVMFRTISGKTKQKEPSLLRRNSRNYQTTNNRRRVCIIFAVMATIFATCWLPWFMLALLVNLNVHVENLESFMKWFVPFRYLTSIINPLLYTFFKPDFRRAFKEMLFSKISCKYPQTNMTWRRVSFRFPESFRSNRQNAHAPVEKQGAENNVFVSSV